jgi:hypothetical protein
MNNNLLQIKIKQRLNKLASLDYDNIECWQIQEAFNKAQLEWVRRMMYGLNTRREGTEQSTGLVDDLQVILKSQDLTPVDKQTFFEATLPADYLYYVRTDVYANSKCCPDKRKMVVYEVEEANMGVLLTSDTKGPSFEWGETLSTLVGDKLRVYTNGEFNITDVGLVYYRTPRQVQFQGCVNPITGQAFTANQECEFKDDVAEILVDQAAAILAGDIESMNQYQRQSQEVQKNS